MRAAWSLWLVERLLSIVAELTFRAVPELEWHASDEIKHLTRWAHDWRHKVEQLRREVRR